MLKKRRSDFREMVAIAAARVGNNAPRIADIVIREAFPVTLSAAEDEGADRMLRTGVVTEIKRVLRSGTDDAEQHDFGDIAPEFQAIARRLGAHSFLVPSLREYVPVTRLVAEPALLDEARKFMRSKGLECIGVADVLDQLFVAVTGDGDP